MAKPTGGLEGRGAEGRVGELMEELEHPARTAIANPAATVGLSLRICLTPNQTTASLVRFPEPDADRAVVRSIQPCGRLHQAVRKAHYHYTQ